MADKKPKTISLISDFNSQVDKIPMLLCQDNMEIERQVSNKSKDKIKNAGVIKQLDQFVVEVK